MSPASGLKVGDRLLLVFFPGLDFTASLIACFKAGLIAVPVFPPDPRRLKKDLHHFVSIQKSCDATVALTNSQYNFLKKIEDIKNFFSAVQWPNLKWLVIDGYLKRGKKQTITNKPPYPSNDSIAFLQYTSGSTSEPKGVMISHGNLGHNLTLICTAGIAIQSSVCISWLPQYHDMGLIGTYLGILYAGGKGYFLSPISFLKDPVVWVRAFSKYHGTHSPSPNFAYALVVRKFKEQRDDPRNQGLDLHTAVSLINAAEPVNFHSIQEFYETFSPYSLPGNVVQPTYGLAEHTVFVCSNGELVLTVKKSALELGRVEVIAEDTLHYDTHSKALLLDAAEVQRLVGCGHPKQAEAVTVVIVDRDSKVELEDPLAVGEVWVSSPSKALGYWNRPEQSLEDFQAILPNYPTTAFLRTGDMGFMYKDELFICGRLKDMIIVGGSNHYPQDIEGDIEMNVGEYLRAGCSAAFAIQSNNRATEDAAYVAELKDNINSNLYPDIVKRIREVVSQEHGLSIRIVCLLRTRTVPKTTSGKIARSWCRRGLMDGTLSILYRSEEEGGNSSGSLGDGIELTAGGGDNTKDGYQKVPVDGNTTAAPTSAAKTTPPPPEMSSLGPTLPAAELRRLPINDIKTKLERALVLISTSGPTALQAPINPSVSLLALGLDSMTIVQYQGVLENKFHCKVPDEFNFSDIATLLELSIAVQNGGLTADQRQRFEANAGGAAGGAGNANGQKSAASTASVAPRRQPFCPWFTCCY